MYWFFDFIKDFRLKIVIHTLRGFDKLTTYLKEIYFVLTNRFQGTEPSLSLPIFETSASCLKIHANKAYNSVTRRF